MSALLVASMLWLGSFYQKVVEPPKPAPPTAEIPRNETPKNVRPYKPSETTTPATNNKENR